MEKLTIIAGKMEEILNEACQRELNCDVQRVGADGVMRSRLLEAKGGPNEAHLVMDLPSEGGRTAAVREGDRLEVTIQVGGQRLSFRVAVKGRCFHEVREGTRIPAILTTYPTELERKQRRAYYRVNVPLKDACEVVLSPFEPGAGGLCRGVVEDLSAGGMGIQYREEGTALPGVGEQVQVFFELPGKGGNVALMGRIQNLRPRLGGQVLVGVEFMAEERSLETRRGIGAIGQYVATRQREVLKKNADLQED